MRIDGKGRSPKRIVPPLSCEAHSHIYDLASEYPHVPGRKSHIEASLEAYETLLARLGFERGVIVQSSLYGSDNTCTLNAIRTLGPDRAREVAVTRRDVNNAELQKLHESDIRGLRFYFLVDDFVVDDLATMARKIAPMSWHVQVQDDGDWLLDVLPILKSLPVDSVLDHIGRTPAAGGINDSNFQALLRFLESGKLWVKISAPYLQILDGPPYYTDVGEKVKAMVSVRPDRLVWAANWPHPNLPEEAKPEEADCLDPLLEWVPDDAILADNPAKLYGF